MSLRLDAVEHILHSERRLRVIYDEGYELSFESDVGLQIAVNRKSTIKAIRIWIQNTIDPHKLALSPTVEIVHYEASKPRAHLSASRLTGPYEGRTGNDCWYIAFKQESDVRALVTAYLT